MGIQALLYKTGVLAWADDSILLAQVERVSRGDPFYLRYLVQDIAAGLITSAQIERQPAGLETYLDGWWRQVVGVARRDQEARDLLGLLLVVLGPLPTGDLFRLAPNLEWGFDAILTPLHRFIIVSREIDQPAYTLCHPRFQRYLAEHKLQGQVDAYDDRLLAYCACWSEHYSRYALRYYADHLAESYSPDRTKKLKTQNLHLEALFALARDPAFAAAQRHHLPESANPSLHTPGHPNNRTDLNRPQPTSPQHCCCSGGNR